jgi:leucyl-tRNA synthetase
MINSGPFDGLPSEIAAQKISDAIEQGGSGKRTVLYRMRDWLISRQRYWGTPIPIIHCPACGEAPVPEEQLPVLLPQMENFQPDGSGRSPLARLPEFVNTTCPQCGGPAQRETDTMGGFACSSWYFLRFTSPHEIGRPFDPDQLRYWMKSPEGDGVDLYIGGAEHAVLHLLYARFWIKALADMGLLPFREPFRKLMNQGQLMGLDGQRMSKSRGNVITPDEMVDAYGADSLRIYEMFMAPFEQDIAWSSDGIQGSRRFLGRVWHLFSETWNPPGGAPDVEDPELERLLHKTIQRVSERIQTFRFNTMVSTLMEFVNNLSERHQSGNWQTAAYHRAMETLLVLLAPAAPHITEELWQLTGHTGSVHQQRWPVWDEALVSDAWLQIPVQVDGKVREVIEVESSADEAAVRQRAVASPRVQAFLTGREIVRAVYVPGKIMNIVTRS